MAELLIRDAQKQDSPRVVYLIKELAGSDADKYPLDSAYIEYYLNQPGCHILVAERSGYIHGVLSYSIRPNLYHAGPTCMIEELIVCQPERGRGIGGELLDAAIQRARESGCAEISITTDLDNQSAIRLYRRHGLVDEAVYLEMHFRD